MKKEFFAGASTPKGFFTYLPSVLPDMQTGFRYDIKGSSGSGKSTMMRRIAAVMRENGVETEYLHCASDPSSLDGLIFPKLQLARILYLGFFLLITNRRPLRLTITQSGVRFFKDALVFIS